MRSRSSLRLFVVLGLSVSPVALQAGGLDSLFAFIQPTKSAALTPASLPQALGQFSAQEIKTLKRSIAAYKAGDIAQGDAISTELGQSVPGIVAEWVAIRSQASTLGYTRISHFLAAYPEWPTQSLMRRGAEEAIVAEKQPASVVRSFFARNTPATPGGVLMLAEAMMAEGKSAAAIELVRNKWVSDGFNQDLENKILASFGQHLKRADHQRRFERAIFGEDADVALRAAQRLGPEETAIARAAAAVFDKNGNGEKLVSAIPQKAQSETTAQFLRVKQLRRAERYAEAATVLGQVNHANEQQYGTPWWVERRLIARKLTDTNQAALAYKVAAGHAASTIPDKVEAEFTAGWIALRALNQADKASHHFDLAASVAKTPISIARAAYWQGRAAEAQGKQAGGYYQRAAHQGTTYYGQLSLAKLGQSAVSVTPGPQGSVQAISRNLGVQGVAALYAAEERALAVALINDLAYSLPDAPALDALADLTTAYGDANATLTISKIATQRNLVLGQHAFPIFGIPQKALDAAPIEQAFVYAITRQESAFDPAATSTSGAKGLMQLMPATAKIEAGKVGVDFDAGRLTDPHYNVTLGANHLSRLVENWNGSYILAIASYNAGPGNAKKWIEAFGDPRNSNVDPIDWVERIPFSETRNYVQRVLENLQVYRAKLGNRQALMIDQDIRRGAR